MLFTPANLGELPSFLCGNNALLRPFIGRALRSAVHNGKELGSTNAQAQAERIVGQDGFRRVSG